MTGRATLRIAVVAAVLAATALLDGALPGWAAAARPGPDHSWSGSSGSSSGSVSTSVSAPTVSTATPGVASSPDASIVQAAQQGVADAAAQGVQQSVAVIDRSTGLLVADVGGEQVYNTESLTKLFTAAYYLEQAQGSPDASLTGELATMIEVSDDAIQSSLWRSSIVPTVAARYGLTSTTNADEASSGNWGSDRTTADDMVTYLLRASQDPWVGSSVLSWMGSAQPTGADGFDQSFGLFSLTGDRGVKQGWSDADWWPRNLHSVGWTDRYFIAILQSSSSASFDTMRSTSTVTAQLLGGPAGPATTTPTSSSSASSSTASSSASSSSAADADPTTAAVAETVVQAVQTAEQALLAPFGE